MEFLIIFSDTSTSNSLIHSISNQSLGFSAMQSSDGVFDPEYDSLASVNNNMNESFDYPNTNQNILQTLVAYSDHSETETSSTECSVRRGSRRRVPNTKYVKDYISPTISPKLLSKTVSPKRNISSSTDGVSDSASEQTHRGQSKKTKRELQNSANRQQSVLKRLQNTTTLGNLNLLWPRYGIKNGVYAGESFSDTRTCSVDTGLFALYHAYRAANDKFRNLLENNTLDVFIALCKTFQRVEDDG